MVNIISFLFVFSEYAQGSPTVIRSPANRVIAHSQLDHAYPRYSPVATSNRGVVLSHSAGNLSNAAMIATDPSRAANDNAPAPFLIPSRGTKPIQRSRSMFCCKHIRWRQTVGLRWLKHY